MAGIAPPPREVNQNTVTNLKMEIIKMNGILRTLESKEREITKKSGGEDTGALIEISRQKADAMRTLQEYENLLNELKLPSPGIIDRDSPNKTNTGKVEGIVMFTCKNGHTSDKPVIQKKMFCGDAIFVCTLSLLCCIGLCFINKLMRDVKCCPVCHKPYDKFSYASCCDEGKS